nr:hypothetical protein [uncultured Psychroserpens sp.]
MKKALLFLLAISLLSCNSEEETEAFPDALFEPILIAQDNLYGNGDEGILQQNLVITDQDSWMNLIAQMDSVNNESSNFSEIDINFSEYIIIAVFDHLRTNGGHVIELDIVTDPAYNVTVNIANTISEGGVNTVMTQPYHIVKVPAFVGEVTFSNN